MYTRAGVCVYNYDSLQSFFKVVCLTFSAGIKKLHFTQQIPQEHVLKLFCKVKFALTFIVLTFNCGQLSTIHAWNKGEKLLKLKEECIG